MTKRDDADGQPKIRAKMTNNWVDYPHNDLSHAAWFFQQRINNAFREEKRADGIFLEMIACVTMIAFSFEGYVNFIGSNLLDGHSEEWSEFERMSVRDKLKKVRRLTGIHIEWNKRPYSTVSNLFKIRNILAHPKPLRAEPREWIAEGTDSALKKILRDYTPAWVKLINQAFINEAFEDVETIWKDLLAAAKIEEHESWSGGFQGFKLIDILPGDKPA